MELKTQKERVAFRQANNLTGGIFKLMQSKNGDLIGKVSTKGHERNIINYTMSLKNNILSMTNLERDGERVARIFSQNCGELPLKIDPQNKFETDILASVVDDYFNDWRREFYPNKAMKVLGRHYVHSLKRESLKGLTKTQALDLLELETKNALKLLYGVDKKGRTLKEIKKLNKKKKRGQRKLSEDYTRFSIDHIQFLSVIHEEKGEHIHAHIYVNNVNRFGYILDSQNDMRRCQQFCLDMCKRQGFKPLDYKPIFTPDRPKDVKKKKQAILDEKLTYEEYGLDEKFKKKVDKLDLDKVENDIKAIAKNNDNVVDFVKDVKGIEYNQKMHDLSINPIVNYDSKKQVKNISFEVVNKDENKVVTTLPSYGFETVSKEIKKYKVSKEQELLLDELMQNEIENKWLDVINKNIANSENDIEGYEPTTNYLRDEHFNIYYKKPLNKKYENYKLISKIDNGFRCHQVNKNNVKEMALMYATKLKNKGVYGQEAKAVCKAQSQEHFDLLWLELKKLGITLNDEYGYYKRSDETAQQYNDFLTEKIKNNIANAVLRNEGNTCSNDFYWLTDEKFTLECFEEFLKHNILYTPIFNSNIQKYKIEEIINEYSNPTAQQLKKSYVENIPSKVVEEFVVFNFDDEKAKIERKKKLALEDKEKLLKLQEQEKKENAQRLFYKEQAERIDNMRQLYSQKNNYNNSSIEHFDILNEYLNQFNSLDDFLKIEAFFEQEFKEFKESKIIENAIKEQREERRQMKTLRRSRLRQEMKLKPDFS